jgi:hypothetical protein
MTGQRCNVTAAAAAAAGRHSSAPVVLQPNAQNVKRRSGKTRLMYSMFCYFVLSFFFFQEKKRKRSAEEMER